ncbi:hypothetical protein ACSQ67_003405 [Phaseolus vulgaris]
MERERMQKRPRLAWDVALLTVPEVGFFQLSNSDWIKVVSTIAFLSGSDKLYTGSTHETVRIWDYQSRKVGKHADLSILLASFVGFGMVMNGSSIVLEFSRWRRRWLVLSEQHMVLRRDTRRAMKSYCKLS